MAKKSLISQQGKLKRKLDIARAHKRKLKFSTKVYNRCGLCGRSRSYIREFNLCRICFRQRVTSGEIIGCKKSSW